MGKAKKVARQEGGGGWHKLSTVWLGAAFLGLLAAYQADWLRAPGRWGANPQTTNSGEQIEARFGLCHTGGGTNCVVDGDTLWVAGVNVRVLGIDAPETHDYGCMAERALGERATKRLQQLVNSGPIALTASGKDEDRYGRKLRRVAVNGKNVGETLIAEGLARPYSGGRKTGWC